MIACPNCVVPVPERVAPGAGGLGGGHGRSVSESDPASGADAGGPRMSMVMELVGEDIRAQDGRVVWRLWRCPVCRSTFEEGIGDE